MASSQPSNPIICISAPGKVILHGEHSVVYNKLAVAASLGLRTRLEYYENVENKNVVGLDFASLQLLHFYNLQDIQDLVNTPLPLTAASSSAYNFTHPELLNHEEVLNTVKNFVKEKSSPLEATQELALTSFFYLLWSFLGPLNVDLQQFKIKVASELTVSAGTGSSASFAVTLVAFLFQYIRVKKLQPKSHYKTFKIDNTNFEKFEKNELELISKWAFQSEKIIHGMPSGVDNTICTYGGLVEFRKGTTPKLVELSTKFGLILVNTNVPRDTKRLVGLVVERREKYKSIVDSTLDIMDHVTIAAVECIKKLNGQIGDNDVVESYKTLGELVDMNQNLLRCLGVSHVKLDEICLYLDENGLHGKLTGAGGGGYAICLVPPYFEKHLVAKVTETLNSKGFEAVFTDLGGCGVSIDTL